MGDFSEPMIQVTISAHTAEELRERIISMADLYRGTGGLAQPDADYYKTPILKTDTDLAAIEQVPEVEVETYPTDTPAPAVPAFPFSEPKLNVGAPAPAGKLTAVPEQPGKEVATGIYQIELDAAGQPWNAELHSANKTKASDGTWRARRNIKEKITDAIKSVVSDKLTPEVASPVVQPVPVAPSPLNAANVFAHTFQSFKVPNNLTATIAALLVQGKITQEYVSQLNAYFKVNNLWELYSHEDKLLELFEQFVKLGLITKVE